ncbi:MAG: 50S ribosomal protein L4 [Atribacterota bacterium]|nr:50S ribosomal protein L4 [Atribacterota bacterium]
MIDMKIHSVEGETIGEIKLNEDLFNAKINKHIVHQIVKRYLADKRRGTASTKGRSDVRGGGKKPWKQKGTGRARAGTIRSPLWVGGGIVFGPQVRDYGFSIPKKMKLVALKSVLSDKVTNDNMIILDKIELKNGKTKEITEIFNKFNLNNEKILIVIEKENEQIKRAINNLTNVIAVTANKINTYDVLNSNKVLVTKNALEVIEEVFL